MIQGHLQYISEILGGLAKQPIGRRLPPYLVGCRWYGIDSGKFRAKGVEVVMDHGSGRKSGILGCHLKQVDLILKFSDPCHKISGGCGLDGTVFTIIWHE